MSAAPSKKQPPAGRTLRMYATYSFVDKDPVIDKLRTVVQRVSVREGKSFDATVDRLAIDAGLSTSTPYGWFKGKTKRPQHASINAFALAGNFELVFREKR